MRWIRTSVVSGLVLLAGALLVACGGTATTNQQPETAATAHLTAYGQGDGTKLTAILTGAIGDFGKAVFVHANGTIDPEHSADLQLRLMQGSFRLSVVGLDKKLVSAFGRVQFNAKTRSGHVSVTGAAPIVSGSGSGSYKGIGGSFTLTITIDEIVQKPATTPSGTILAQIDVITGSGGVSLP